MYEPTHYLAEVLVATTWQCNLACSYCFVHQHGLSTANEQMSPELATRVVDALDVSLDSAEVICLHLYGGEPLMNLPAMEAMVKRTGEKRTGRFRFAITTNGFSASLTALELLEAGHFQVILSIDGPAEVHNECRRTKIGMPTHTKIMRFLDNLRSRTHCSVRASAVVRSGWRLSQANAYLRSLPVHFIKAQAVRLPPGAPYAMSEIERQDYLSDLEAVGRHVISDLEAGCSPWDDRFSSRVLQLLSGIKRKSFCGAGETTFGITPDGTVLPCTLIASHCARLGHITDKPALWLQAGHHWRAAQKRRTRCNKCFAFSLCGGGCPAMIAICGDDECDIIRKNCEVAIRIYEHFRSTPMKLLPLAGIT